MRFWNNLNSKVISLIAAFISYQKLLHMACFPRYCHIIICNQLHDQHFSYLSCWEETSPQSCSVGKACVFHISLCTPYRRTSHTPCVSQGQLLHPNRSGSAAPLLQGSCTVFPYLAHFAFCREGACARVHNKQRRQRRVLNSLYYSTWHKKCAESRAPGYSYGIDGSCM